MNINNYIYNEDLNKVCKINVPWEKLIDKTLIISGANGLIGSFLIDVIMKKNIESNLNCTIIALVRNLENAKKRFNKYLYSNNCFKIISCDVNNLDTLTIDCNIDYIIHLASNTHPKAYSLEPITTITTNIIGTYNLLKIADEKKIKRFVFASTCEIYGENRGDIDKFSEDYCGYINCNTLRAGYPESKRCGESLCQAYITQKNLDIVIPRLTRTYGPTMLMSDTKALSQFIKNGVENKDIVLKSDGTQKYSYIYVADAVSALITIMLLGKCGEAYNISDEKSDINLKDLAKLIADFVGMKVIFEKPDSIEKAGYSKVTKALLDNSKLKELGWNAQFDIEKGIKNTINILNEGNFEKKEEHHI